MRRIKYLILFALVALVSVSCAKQFDHLLKENEVVSISSSNPYKISGQEALNELNLFLKSLSGDTKSTSNNLLSQKKLVNFNRLGHQPTQNKLSLKLF